MATIDQILAERRRRARKAAAPARHAARFRRAAPPPPPPAPAAAGPVPFAQTQAGLTFAAEQARIGLDIERQNAEALARQQARDDLVIQAAEQKFLDDQLKQRLADEARVRAEERERTRQANISQLKVERQGTFASLMKSGDQARAVMFALGFGPESDVFDVRAQALGTTIKPLKGVRELRHTTEAALGKVLGRKFSVAGGVTIGREGVRGLGTAIGAARQFVQGGADIQTLLTSAFGVGSLRKGERPGISQARLTELVQSVTPTGVLP